MDSLIQDLFLLLQQMLLFLVNIKINPRLKDDGIQSGGNDGDEDDDDDDGDDEDDCFIVEKETRKRKREDHEFLDFFTNFLLK